MIIANTIMPAIFCHFVIRQTFLFLPPTKLPHSSQKTSRSPPQNAKDERKKREMPRLGERQTHAFIRRDADLCAERCASCFRKMRIFAPDKCASFKRQMRICKTQDAHPPERKPRICRKSARHLATKRTRTPSCGRCASPVKPLARISPADCRRHRRRPAWCLPPRRAAQSTPAAPCPRGRGCRRRCSGASVRG